MRLLVESYYMHVIKSTSYEVSACLYMTYKPQMYTKYMVRKDELPETTETTEIISKYIHDELQSQQITYDDVAEQLKRAKSYVGLRISGLKAWNLDELDILASMLKLDSAFQLVNNARAYNQMSKNREYTYSEDFDLAANEDINKESERELDDFGA